MTELTVYNSRGIEYGGGTGRKNGRIENFFFAGVRLYAQFGTQTKLVVFFRARESDASRAEQYYAVYKTRTSRHLFSNFKSELKQRLESEYGMILETTGSDVEVFNKLEQGGTSLPGSEFDQKLFSQLLREGHQIRVSVPSNDEALAMISHYLQDGGARSVAIADESGIDELNSCDLVIETDESRGLTPLGETRQLMDQRRRQREGEFIRKKVGAIKNDVQELKQHTTLSDQQLRKRLQHEIPALATSSPSQKNKKSGPLAIISSLGQGPKIAALGIGLVVVLLIVGLAGINVAALAGIAIPTQLSPLVFLGGDSAEITTVNDEGVTDERMAVEGPDIVIEGTSTEEVYFYANDNYLTNSSSSDGTFEETVTIEESDDVELEMKHHVENGMFDTQDTVNLTVTQPDPEETEEGGEDEET